MLIDHVSCCGGYLVPMMFVGGIYYYLYGVMFVSLGVCSVLYLACSMLSYLWGISLLFVVIR